MNLILDLWMSHIDWMIPIIFGRGQRSFEVSRGQNQKTLKTQFISRRETWMNVSAINMLHIASLVYLYTSSLLPNCFDNLFTVRNSIYSYGTVPDTV